MMDSRDRALVYARQRNQKIPESRVGWGFRPTPKQARRLQKKYARDMRRTIQKLKGL